MTWSARRRDAPLALVALAVAFGLVELWPEHLPAAYRNDEAFHIEMVRFALQRLREGHDPLTSWFSPINLGSPVYLHYQGLPSMLTAVLGLALGPLAAFGWTVYLLLATWPVTVYLGARLLGLDRWPAAAAASLAPLLSSAPGVGYEWHSYLSIGWGVWTQLWAMFVMPLAWGFTYQAITRRRHLAAAMCADALVVCLHYESGYIMAIPIVVLPLVAIGSRDFWRVTARALAVGAGGLLLSSWVVFPVFFQREWAARNELLAGTPSADSFGARRVLSWLVDGRLFDGPVQGHGRPPVLTVLVLVGLAATLARWRSSRRARPLVVLFVVSLVLFFGRPTLGPALDLLPGAADLFLRRFVAAVQLSGLLLSGVGALVLARGLRAGAERLGDVVGSRLGASARDRHPPDRHPPDSHPPDSRRGAVARPWRRGSVAAPRRQLAVLPVVAIFVAALAPAWIQMARYARSDARDLARQRHADATTGAEVNRLLAVVRRRGGGRVYAGQVGTRLGEKSRVGGIELYVWLADEEVDAVGFTQRSASLMSDAEPSFVASNPSDYDIFAVHWLLLPQGVAPPVRAELVERAGAYALFSTAPLGPASGYLEVVDTQGVFPENRTDVGSQSAGFLAFDIAARGVYPTVAWDGHAAAPPTLGLDERRPAGSPGTVLHADVALADGRASAAVVARRRAVVLLKASFDPGWHALVDGRPAPTVMVAPALVGVEVGPGRHEVSFAYSGFSWYPLLFALAGSALVLLLAGSVAVRLLGRAPRRDP